MKNRNANEQYFIDEVEERAGWIKLNVDRMVLQNKQCCFIAVENACIELKQKVEALEDFIKDQEKVFTDRIK